MLGEINVLSAALGIQAHVLRMGFTPATLHIERTQAVLCETLEVMVDDALRIPPEHASVKELVWDSGETSRDAPDVREEERWEPCDATILASRCRALLLEVVRRAAHDWILYRTSRRRPFSLYAADAYVWLFEEGPGHPDYELRQGTEGAVLSLHAICEALDLDIEALRARVRSMTKSSIATGRPAESRRRAKDVSLEDYETPPELEVALLSDPGFVRGYCADF